MVAAAAATAAQASPAAPRATTPGAKTLAARTAADLVARKAPALHVSAGDTLVQKPVISTRDGLQYVPYNRTYRGLPVYGGDFVVVTDAAGRMLSTSVAQTAAIHLPSIPPAVSSARAPPLPRSQHQTTLDSRRSPP